MTSTDTEKVDYLEVDMPINGQQFCCLSFIEPEYLEEKMQQLVKGHLDNEKLKEDLFEQRRLTMLEQIKIDTKTEKELQEEKNDDVDTNNIEKSEKSEESKQKRKKRKELPPELKSKLQEQMKMFQCNEDNVRSEHIQSLQEVTQSKE